MLYTYVLYIYMLCTYILYIYMLHTYVIYIYMLYIYMQSVAFRFRVWPRTLLTLSPIFIEVVNVLFRRIRSSVLRLTHFSYMKAF